MVFASFFPTVVAGPIERAHRLLPQVVNDKKFELNNIRYGFFLIVQGLFRKVLIGDAIGRMINHIFADPQYYTSFEIIIAILLYSLQIYNDFAGYSSIARGVAKLLGYDIYINFKQPYFSSSVAEFWRRWHISLSLWLKDFIFSPLQLKFRDYKSLGNIIALMITFTLCGLWHGPNWTFVFWGFLHGFYMSFAILFSNQKKYFSDKVKDRTIKKLITIILTFTLVTVGWTFFRAESFSNLILILGKIIEFSSGEFVLRFLKMSGTFFIVSFGIDYFEKKFNTDAVLLKLKPSIGIPIAIVVIIVVFSYLLTSDKAPFIYAQF
jgi:D-alanyl-lipoteichoic acid acyltransferase DltB (MBOAT superfamily)